MPPTELDIELLPEVLEVIDTYGRLASFYTVPSGYSAATGTATAGTLIGTRKIAPLAHDIRLMDADLIQQGDTGTILAASGLTFTPAVDQRVVVGSKEFLVVATKEYESGEQTCAWSLHLRGA